MYFKKAKEKNSNGAPILLNTSFSLSKPQVNVKQLQLMRKMTWKFFWIDQLLSWSMLAKVQVIKVAEHKPD